MDVNQQIDAYQRGVSFLDQTNCLPDHPVPIRTATLATTARLAAECCVWQILDGDGESQRSNLSFENHPLHHHGERPPPIHITTSYIALPAYLVAERCQKGAARPKFDGQRLDKEEVGVRPPLRLGSKRRIGGTQAGRRLRKGSRKK